MKRTDLRPTLALLSGLLLALPSGAGAAVEENGKDVFGYVERVVIGPGNLTLRAKLDTGADTSSLDAVNIRRFRRGEKRFVRFTLEDPTSGETLTVERRLVRRATIKRHDGEHQRRSVVKIEICLGGHRQKVEVSLIDRSQFAYPVLLGRSALEGIAVVDPELTFTREPACGMNDGAG